MPYITTAELAERPGSREIALLATSDGAATVDYALMDATLRGQDRSAWQADDIAQADAALQRVQDAIAEADALIDGYLGKRYTLPLSSPPGILTTWARAIVRYKLHGDRLSTEGNDPIVRDYKDALKFLEQIAAGKFSLGIEDPSSQGNGLGEVRIDPGKKVFGREFLP